MTSRRIEIASIAGAMAVCGALATAVWAADAPVTNKPPVVAPAAAPAAAPAPAPAPAPAVAPTAAQPAEKIAVAPAAKPAADTNFVVSVDGVKLSAADADARAEQRLTRVKDRVPADRLDRMRTALQGQITEEFILQTLMSNAAKKQAVSVTEQDVSQFIDEKIKAKLPPGTTLDDVMKRENINEAELRRDIELQITIKKLVDLSLGGKAEPTDQEVTDFYSKQKANFDMPETVHARHILVTVKSDDTDKIKAEKKAKAESLRQQIVDGADFAKVAAANSDCPSKTVGGDLGTFPRGKMVKDFEKAAFAQKVNEVGPLVQTDFGYHIIQVIEHNQARTMPLDEAKANIKQMLTQQAEQKAFETLFEKMKQDAKIVYGSGVAPGPGMQP